MKIGEARNAYSYQLRTFNQKNNELIKQRQALDEKIKTTENGAVIYKNEAATLELQQKAVDKKRQEYQDYMDRLMEQWSGINNSEVAKQQGDAMAEQGKEMSKVMTVARRIMHGDKVPAKDEKKLMEFDWKLYAMAKNAAAMLEAQRKRKEHKSLWEDEEEKVYDDPGEVADNSEAFAEGPEVATVDEVVASATSEISISVE